MWEEEIGSLLHQIEVGSTNSKSIQHISSTFYAYGKSFGPEELGLHNCGSWNAKMRLFGYRCCDSIGGIGY
jgi:hypothetical protein